MCVYVSWKFSGCFSKEENIKTWKAFLQRYNFKTGIIVAENRFEEETLLQFSP